MAPPCKYHTEEERIIAHKEAQKKYLMKQFECEVCDCIIKQKNKNRHLRSTYHANKQQRYLVPDRHLNKTNEELSPVVEDEISISR